MKSKIAHPFPHPPLSSLARALVRAGRLSESRAQALVKAARHTPGRLAAALVQDGVMDATALARFASQQLGYPLLDLASINTALLPHGLLNDTLRNSEALLPLSYHAGRLSVAMADPTDSDLLEALQHTTAMPLAVVVADIHQLRAMLANN